MTMNPRDPLHRPRFDPRQAAPQSNRLSGIPMPNEPKPNTPDDGNKPGRASVGRGRRQKRIKLSTIK